MTATAREYDIIAVGGGTAGLVTAAGAAYLGADVALVEAKALGGDCLWTGCVPSKALIASARRAREMRAAGELGLRPADPDHVFREVMERMRAARARVEEHDDPERFRQMGVDVHFGRARFAGPGRLDVEDVGELRSDRIVIATGARPAPPPIPGLEEAGYLTHETFFDIDDRPPSMVILGGGPIGIEFAQLLGRLGTEVTVVEMLPRILPAEDPAVAGVVEEVLRSEGVRIRTGSPAVRVEMDGERRVVVTEDGERHSGHRLLVATGRTPATSDLALDRAGIATEGPGIRVDGRLETTAGGVWAAGDVTGGLQFTHYADHQAKVAVQNALSPIRTTVDDSAVPRVTYTDPEAASVGLSREEAEERGAETYRYDFSDLDRSIVEGRTDGFVTIHADGKGRIAGASIVGDGAGELILPLVLAMNEGIGLSGVAGTIFPYPTRVEGVKRAADAYRRTRLEGTAGTLVKKVLRWLW